MSYFLIIVKLENFVKHSMENQLNKNCNVYKKYIRRKIQSQSRKNVKCSICVEEFSCKQYMETHMEETNNYRGSFMCQVCDKGFLKMSLWNTHEKKNYLTTPRMCGKMYAEYLKICKRKKHD